MISADSEQPHYKTQFTNGKSVSFSDTTFDKGGSGAGFRPHDLLEAALASCMNMSIRMFAQEHAIPLFSVSTTVTLDRSTPDETCFEYRVKLSGDLSAVDRKRLIDVTTSCPVRRTLSQKLTFREHSCDGQI
ncbi:MAG: OsmC family protein [Desulfobacterales bacterium]|nr:OsmC family protein [Desulfobacterales bacterium]